MFLTSEEEIKLRLFESIAANSKNLCDSSRYMSPECVAGQVNSVYYELFKKEK